MSAENLFKPILISIIEGLTEFIPVSSTGHMVLAGHFIDFEGEKAATFEIFIQLGAILAAVWIYREKFLGFVSIFNQKKLSFRDLFYGKSKPDVAHVIFAITPALFMGFLLYPIIKNHLFTPFTVALGLIVGGIVMIIVERVFPNQQTEQLEDISHKQAFWIGLGQCFSLWPGVSRSGSTMITSLILGIKHKPAADFSFIIAVPVMVAAVSYDLLKSWKFLSLDDLSIFAVGFVVAFLVAWTSIKWFLKILQRVKLFPFGVYRVVLGALTIYFTF